jgi:hypothetical protein
MLASYLLAHFHYEKFLLVDYPARSAHCLRAGSYPFTGPILQSHATAPNRDLYVHSVTDSH